MTNVSPDMQVYNEVLQQRLGALEMENLGLTTHTIVQQRTIEQQGELIAQLQGQVEGLRNPPSEPDPNAVSSDDGDAG